MTGRTTVCRVCGCDDDHACAGGCGWVQAGLCSACVGAVRHVACSDCGANPGNAWCRRPSGHSGPMVAFHRARIDAAHEQATAAAR